MKLNKKDNVNNENNATINYNKISFNCQDYCYSQMIIIVMCKRDSKVLKNKTQQEGNQSLEVKQSIIEEMNNN